MCYAVALPTLREFIQYPLRMRIRVARKARGDDLMFVPVAKGTAKIVVFGRVLFKQAQSLLVTGPAIMGGSIL